MFEEVCRTIAATGPDAYLQLCQKVLPSLTGAFDVGEMSEENALTNLAADMLAELTRSSKQGLPQGFISTVMPRLNRQLLGSNDGELLKACTTAVRFITRHDSAQLFAWQDTNSGKHGLEVVLVIIDRLLGASVEDNAAAEVGGLAAEVVEQAGFQQLGPYLPELLRAIAIRLSIATQAQLIQNLILVFARLALASPSEIIEFLAQVSVSGDTNGLSMVMAKWLENSTNFAGYDDIRQNLSALMALYRLHDARLEQISVRGDLIVPKSDRIMTRSRARQNPDQYTSVSAPLKIVKVLIEELQPVNLDAATATAGKFGDENGESGEEDNDDWEDEDGDLGFGSKQDLLAYAEETPGMRQSDNETQVMLVEFFKGESQDARFSEAFAALNAEEQDKLRAIG